MSKKVRILSIDGGGIRGVIPATIIKYIENELIKRTQNKDARIADYFDLIVGTSTGGILTCFYLTPNDQKEGPKAKYTANQALEFYSKYGYSIFNESKRFGWFGIRQLFNATQYSPKALEKIILKTFGDLKLSELMKKCLVTTYTMNVNPEPENKRSKSAFFFTNDEDTQKREFYVRDAIRSTSAAPTFFPPANITNLANGSKMINIDGGVFANNPAMCSYAEARKTRFNQQDPPSAKNMLLLSIGTGGGQFALPGVENSQQWGVISWAKNIPNIMMDGSVDTVDHQMLNLFATLEGKDTMNYKRIDVAEKDKIYSSDMADASPENIKKLIEAGNRTLDRVKNGTDKAHGLDRFIDLLIENHQESA